MSHSHARIVSDESQSSFIVVVDLNWFLTMRTLLRQRSAEHLVIASEHKILYIVVNDG